MHVALIAKPGNSDTGVGRYAVELAKELRAFGHQVTLVHPIIPIPKGLTNFIRRWLSWDLEAFFNNYALWARYPIADIYHITSQNLATLMIFHGPPGKTVVTVHDIIPWIVRADQGSRVYHHKFEEWFDWIALQGIRRADWVVCDSDFSADSLAPEVRGNPPPINTVYLGIS